jgi:hypothetical protein
LKQNSSRIAGEQEMSVLSLKDWRWRIVGFEVVVAGVGWGGTGEAWKGGIGRVHDGLDVAGGFTEIWVAIFGGDEGGGVGTFGG